MPSDLRLKLMDAEVTPQEWLAEIRSNNAQVGTYPVQAFFSFLAHIILPENRLLAECMVAQGMLMLGAHHPAEAGWLLETMAVENPRLDTELRAYLPFAAEIVRALREETR